MAGINVQGFIGAMPGRDPQLLPETAATVSRNNRVESGALDPIVLPRALKNLLAATNFVYRIPDGDPTNIDASFWVEFEDRYTDIYRTPVVNDGYQRYYWASPSTGFKYATRSSLISGGPGAGLIGGVPRPTTPVTLSVVAGTGADHTDDDELKVTRAYVVTFVSNLGEEGAPGPAAEATGYADQDWWLRDIPQPVIRQGYTDISIIRVYRTVTGLSGSTVFNRVVDLQVGTLTYMDRLSDAQVSGQTQLESTNADEPPSMDGLALMPNGVFVGFKDNNLYFSENFKPHSWPAAYTLTVPNKIVGLGVFGTTCVVTTDANPAAVTGASGAVMTLSVSQTSLPCVNRKSIVVAPEGVYYASTAGLVLYGPSGPSIVTDEIFGGQAWEVGYSPASMNAVLYRGKYVATFLRGGTRPAFMVVAGSIVELPNTGLQSVVGVDVYSNKPWLAVGGVLYEWLPAVGTLAMVEWVSKDFVLLNRVTFGVAQVYYEARGDSSVTLEVYAEGALWHSQAVQSQEPFRLPAGSKFDRWSFKLLTNSRVHRVILAETVANLKKV